MTGEISIGSDKAEHTYVFVLVVVLFTALIACSIAHDRGFAKGVEAHYKGEIKCGTAMGEVICKPVKKEVE